MDVYGLNNTQDMYGIDDLLDFSNDDLISSSSTISDSSNLHYNHQNQMLCFTPENGVNNHSLSFSTDFINEDFCIPNDDEAELEWLSQFVDDSFSYFPVNNITGTVTSRSDISQTDNVRIKRSRALSTTKQGCSSSESEETVIGSSKSTAKNDGEWSPPAKEVRRCTHCASEKTPQWRTGPSGQKTLCNACGVRYKSGRLVPEYRPAASPTFVLTKHSNSHRKVMELRRQKEMYQQQQNEQQRRFHHRHHPHDFEVC